MVGVDMAARCVVWWVAGCVRRSARFSVLVGDGALMRAALWFVWGVAEERGRRPTVRSVWCGGGGEEKPALCPVCGAGEAEKKPTTVPCVWCR